MLMPPPLFVNRNLDEFDDAFGIVKGDPLDFAPAERIMIW